MSPPYPQLIKDPADRKMKSAKKKSSPNKTKTDAKQGDLVIVKTEDELQVDGEVEEDCKECCSNGDGLNIQIKEEPHSQEIGEEHYGDTLRCLDTMPDNVTPKLDDWHQLEHLKSESDSDQQPGYELTADYDAVVKEESWIKEEGDSGEEAQDASNNQEDDGEEVCTGRSQ